jgi:hypothetical protein
MSTIVCVIGNFWIDIFKFHTWATSKSKCLRCKTAIIDMLKINANLIDWTIVYRWIRYMRVGGQLVHWVQFELNYHQNPK